MSDLKENYAFGSIKNFFLGGYVPIDQKMAPCAGSSSKQFISIIGDVVLWKNVMMPNAKHFDQSMISFIFNVKRLYSRR